MTKQLRFILPFLALCAFTACQTETPQPVGSPSHETPQTDQRAERPIEKPTGTDPKSLALGTLNTDGTFEESPSKARERFGRLTRERRTASEATLRQKRETFTKEQNTKRDAFLGELKEERSKFAAKKTTPVERREFQAEQEKKRRSYFADESALRKSFEAERAEERRHFEESSREMTKHFNDAIREYSAEYSGRRKRKTIVPKPDSSPTPPDKYRTLLDEFKEPTKGPVIPLKPSGN